MDLLDNYKIDLKSMRTDRADYQFVLDNAYFEAVRGSEVERGQADVHLSVKKTAGAFELTFNIEGIIQIPCDRCLELMDQRIETVSVLKVKLGEEYADEGDIIVIPEYDGVLDVSWLIYEMIALEIPIKHVHEPGQCNGAMMGTLERLMTDFGDQDKEENTVTNHSDGEFSDNQRPIDPRWNELKKILDNN